MAGNLRLVEGLHLRPALTAHVDAVRAPIHERTSHTYLVTGLGTTGDRLRRAAPTAPWSASGAENEIILLLEGSARIEIADGPTLEIGVGDIANLPKGSHVTWHLNTPYRDFSVYAAG